MRSLGMVLGAVFLLDGLVALLAGQQTLRWIDYQVGPRLAPERQQTLKEMAAVDQRVLAAWGINNLFAGMFMMLVAIMSGRE